MKIKNKVGLSSNYNFIGLKYIETQHLKEIARLFKKMFYFMAISLIFNFILTDFIKAQEKSKKNSNQIELIKLDHNTNLYHVQTSKVSDKKTYKTEKKSFNANQFDNKIKKLKKINDQHYLSKNIYETKKQAENKLLLKKYVERIELHSVFFGWKKTVSATLLQVPLPC